MMADDRQFTDEELEVLEVALMSYREDLTRDAIKEPMGDVSGRYTSVGEALIRHAFVAQDLMLRLGIDPVEHEFQLPEER